jgi:hypothetical protein
MRRPTELLDSSESVFLFLSSLSPSSVVFPSPVLFLIWKRENSNQKKKKKKNS